MFGIDGIAHFGARKDDGNDAIAALDADGHRQLLWNKKRDTADGVIPPQQDGAPVPVTGGQSEGLACQTSLLYVASDNMTPQTAPVTLVITGGPTSSFSRNARLSSKITTGSHR